MSPLLLLDLALALSAIALALWTVAARRIFEAVVGFIAFGLLLSLAWVRLGTVDVALTEAAVGAGAGGVLLLGASARLGGRALAEAKDMPVLALRIATGLLCALLSGALAWALLSLPTPAPSLAPLAAANLAATELGNPVSGVLLAWRAMDTLLEAVVLVLAVIGVWSVAGDDAWGGIPGPAQPLRSDPALRLAAQVIPPIGVVIGVHIVWTGADAPGGAFQGGTVLAAMWVLAWMAGLVHPPAVSSRKLRIWVVLGPLVFIAVGLLGCFLADAFLAYPAGFTKPLILVVEAALTFSIAVGLVLLLVGPPEAAR
ncbi:MnhB domain-containing protein [Roseococcus sp.]|uniref:MnhB domain-containing protein n=1 Tax=Roseococcus sp. TaxID=2109646 RepID=UPI003BA914EC